MNITNKQLIDGYVGVNALAKEKLPIVISFKLEILRQNLEPVIDSINLRIDSIKKEYCEKDENSNPIFQKNNKNETVPNAYVFNEANARLVNEAITQFLENRIEFIDIKIRISDFPIDCRVSADTLKLLRGFIEI